MVSKYEHLMPPGVFPDKGTPVIHFTDETVVLCDVLDVKILLQVLVTYKWSQINFDVNTYVLFLDPNLRIVLVS